MINVFSIANAAVGAVNASVVATLKISDGETVNPDFSVSPAETEILVRIKVQAASTSDLQHVENINQQSDARIVYMQGGIKGLNRALRTGGDILNFQGSDWLVTHVIEEWGDGQWSKLLVTRQM